MIKVIRNQAGLYLKSDGTWTNDWKEAKYFKEVQAAISEIQRCRLGTVEYVFIFDDLESREYDVVLTLKSKPTRKRSRTNGSVVRPPGRGSLLAG